MISIPRTTVTGIAATLTLGGLWFAGAPTAGATSCIGSNLSAAELVAGAPMYEGAEGTLLEQYDLVVTGTVRAVGPADGRGANSDETEVTFDVIGAIGVDEIDEQLVVSEADPGYMNGFPFEVGRTYFVPLQSPGPDGEPYWSFVCDPVRDIAVTDAPALLEAAPDGVPTARPVADAPEPTDEPTVDGVDPGTPTTDDSGPGSSDSSGANGWVLGGGGALAAAAFLGLRRFVR